MPDSVLLLGAGELGKELTLACHELGLKVVAVDYYENAPAMQVADSFEVADLLDGIALDQLITKHQPSIIIPEVEAVNRECLTRYESEGIIVAPSAKAHELTASRKAIRHLAAKVLKLKTPNYLYASNLDELIFCVKRIGLPCLVKSLTSSSGKGQSVIKEGTDIEVAWQVASRENSGANLVIVEEYIPFESEITILTVTQKEGPVLFCPVIGNRQQRGDYQESWQPAALPESQLAEAKAMAQQVVSVLGGAGLWGVEFFLTEDKVYFSEVSPGPHDTGMVTLAGTQAYNQFQLHIRAILGLPIPEIGLLKAGASAVILTEASDTVPEYTGLEKAKGLDGADIRIFGKPKTRPYRRMGVALASGGIETDMSIIRQQALEAANTIEVK